MIIKLDRDIESPHLKESHGTSGDERFARLDLLKLTSTKLDQQFGIRLADTDVGGAFELASALSRVDGKPTAAPIRKDRIARLIAARPTLLPCFIGYRQSEDGLLPFMTDGPSGKWSLFFDAEGHATLVEHRGGEWTITPDVDRPASAAGSPAALAETGGLLLGRLRKAARMFGRSAKPGGSTAPHADR